MDKIYINDLLNFSSEEIENTKIKFNVYNGNTEPMEAYKENPDIINNNWLLWKHKRKNLHEGQNAICMLRIGTDAWLLTTIKRITKELDVNDGIGYEAEELTTYRKYYGRLVVKFHNTKRSVIQKFQGVVKDLEVLEILSDMYTGEEFPGYENVRLTWKQLNNIIERDLPGWKPALQNQKAVYLITDIKTGKLYVGSATAQTGMLITRWSNYIKNGHGGNVELKKIVSKNGMDYIKENFQYSILENYNAQMNDDYVLKRESWWKDTLRTRDFGYNKN